MAQVHVAQRNWKPVESSRLSQMHSATRGVDQGLSTHGPTILNHVFGQSSPPSVANILDRCCPIHETWPLGVWPSHPKTIKLVTVGKS